MIIWIWIGFFALIFALLALDLGVLNRSPHRVDIREALWWSALWIAIGVAFSGVIYFLFEYEVGGLVRTNDLTGNIPGGWNAVLQYITAYLLEKSLSLDNIFVMSMIFASFRIPNKYQHRVLFWGILGAIVFRMIFIFGGVWLVKRFDWIFYVFGAYLAFAGIRLLLHKETENDTEHFLVRFLRKTAPVAQEDHGHRFFGKENGRFVVSSLFLGLIAIELTDIIFAVDSIPAVLAISTEQFIVVTSNIFAILGLRSLYFVLAGMINRFERLSTAMSLVLILIGAKMLLHDIVKIPNLISLTLIVFVLAAGIVVSLLSDGRNRE